MNSDGSELPPEILLKIFTYLSLSDVKTCRNVCQSWGGAGSIVLGDKAVLRLDGEDDTVISNYNRMPSSPMAAVAFRNVEFRKISISFSNDSMASKWAWGPIVSRLTSLRFDDCQIGERDFIRILNHCGADSDQCLQSLSINRARDIFMSGMLLSNPKDLEVAVNAFKDVTKLDLSSNQYLTDALFCRISVCCPRVKDLNLSSNRIQHHLGIYKKFYPQTSSSEMSYESPSIFTYKAVLHYLNKLKTLKSLSLCDTFLPESVLCEISKIPGIALEFLDISNNPSIKLKTCLELVQNQRSLRELKMDLCRRTLMDYSRDQMSKIFTLLSASRLKKLSIAGLSCPKGFDECIAELDDLVQLNVKGIDVPSRHLADGIVLPTLKKKKNIATSLRKLIMTYFSSAPLQMARVLNVTVNLVHLDLEECHNGVTDDVVRVICCRIKSLKFLNIAHCDNVTTFGFTGDKCHLLSNQSSEDFAGESFEFFDDGGTIKDLKRMEVIVLTAVRIDDRAVGLFKFNDLRTINLSNCSFVSSIGFRILASNNSHIETLEAMNCKGMDDEAASHIARKLKRLKHLNLSFCYGITSMSIGQFHEYCSFLTFLDVSYCDNLSTIDLFKLRQVENLHIKSKGLDKMNQQQGAIFKKPSPPPPPPLLPRQ